jgi:5-methylcytosine-specific restriction endonuclease McrA
MYSKEGKPMSNKARIPAKIRNAVFARFDCCAACGDRQADECGHLIAEAKGGAMVVENFVRLCGRCNRLQGVATVAFRAYAKAPALDLSYGEALALIESRRAYWARYCKAAAAGIAKPYRPL